MKSQSIPAYFSEKCKSKLLSATSESVWGSKLTPKEGTVSSMSQAHLDGACARTFYLPGCPEPTCKETHQAGEDTVARIWIQSFFRNKKRVKLYVQFWSAWSTWPMRQGKDACGSRSQVAWRPEGPIWEAEEEHTEQVCSLSHH